MGEQILTSLLGVNEEKQPELGMWKHECVDHLHYISNKETSSEVTAGFRKSHCRFNEAQFILCFTFDF